MFKPLAKFVLNSYHSLLRVFFDFDVAVYEVKASKIPVHRLKNFKYTKKIPINVLPEIKCPIVSFDFTLDKLKVRNLIMLKDCIKIRNLNKELYNSIKLREETLEFFCVPRNYETDLHTEKLM